MKRNSRIRTANSFKLAGNSNISHKKLFSTYDYKHAAVGYKGSFEDRLSDNSVVEANGCPKGVHKGLTSLRAKSSSNGAVGVCVPHGNRKLDNTKEYEWVPDPYDGGKYKGVQNKMMTSDGFKVGAKRNGDLFDKEVRLQACNFTRDAGETLMKWAGPNRVLHPRPFTATSYPRGTDDKSNLSGAKNYPYRYAPYEEYEMALVGPNHQFVGNGTRPAIRSGSQTPWRVADFTHPMPSKTNRNPALHAVRSSNNMDYHDGKGTRRACEIPSCQLKSLSV